MNIYISCSSQDFSAANKLIRELEQQEIQAVLFDSILEQEGHVRHVNTTQVTEARGIIVLISSHSKDSPWIAFEVGVAMGLGISVLPVLLTEDKEDVPSFLRQLQIFKIGPELYKEIKLLNRP